MGIRVESVLDEDDRGQVLPDARVMLDVAEPARHVQVLLLFLNCQVNLEMKNTHNPDIAEPSGCRRFSRRWDATSTAAPPLQFKKASTFQQESDFFSPLEKPLVQSFRV